MKMLALAVLLISFPLLGHAKGGNHYGHDYRHYHENDDQSLFWRDVERQRRKQHRRIDRGIEKGQLTRREVKKLYREQKYLAKKIRHLKKHRHVGYSDKRWVMDQLEHVSSKIYHLKHNRHYVDYDRHHHDHVNDYKYKNDDYKSYGRKKGYLSIGNPDYSAGLYFRF